MPNITAPDLLNLLIDLCLVGLPLLAWIYMFRRGAENRELLLWGIIALAIPLFGPIAVMLYFKRRGISKQKNQSSEAKQALP